MKSRVFTNISIEFLQLWTIIFALWNLFYNNPGFTLGFYSFFEDIVLLKLFTLPSNIYWDSFTLWNTFLCFPLFYLSATLFDLLLYFFVFMETCLLHNFYNLWVWIFPESIYNDSVFYFLFTCKEINKSRQSLQEKDFVLKTPIIMHMQKFLSELKLLKSLNREAKRG